MSFLVKEPALFVSQPAGDLIYKTVLCLKRGTSGFLRFYHECPIKTHPAQAYGWDIEILWIFFVVYNHFDIKRNLVFKGK